MIDYKVRYEMWIDDIILMPTEIVTVEEYIDDEELLRDVLQEKLKDKLDCEEITLLEYECLKETGKKNDIYKLTY